MPFSLRVLIGMSRVFPRPTEYLVARTGLKREDLDVAETPRGQGRNDP